MKIKNITNLIEQFRQFNYKLTDFYFKLKIMLIFNGLPKVSVLIRN